MDCPVCGLSLLYAAATNCPRCGYALGENGPINHPAIDQHFERIEGYRYVPRTGRLQ